MPKRPRDANQLAAHIFALSTGLIDEPPAKEKNPATVALGKLGGSKGGNARAANLSTTRPWKVFREETHLAPVKQMAGLNLPR